MTMREAHRTGIRPKRVEALSKMGLSLDQYLDMLEGQEFVCAICYRENHSGRDLAVDHDHATGKVRGLLCNHCNSGLGFFGDSTELLGRAADYLRKSRVRNF